MLITIQKEVKNCYECPCKSRIVEHGCSGYVCNEIKQPYAFIEDKGIREDCPFIEKVLDK